jgi:HD superfamily phosphodiesterase
MIFDNPVYERIYRLARPYLDTRRNDVHVEISLQLALRLLKVEGGDQTIVVPAVILHDVGWKKVPEDLHLKAFGPKATSPEINRIHEEEGVKIAGEILAKVNYGTQKISEILRIIDGHDSQKKALSLNDQVVKDADKLWRYTRRGFEIDNRRFEESLAEGLSRLRKYIDRWFFTQEAYRIAQNELQQREKEAAQ